MAEKTKEATKTVKAAPTGELLDPRIPDQVNVRLDMELQKRLIRRITAIETAAGCKVNTADFLRGIIIAGLNAGDAK